jgi:hypothetical protein
MIARPLTLKGPGEPKNLVPITGTLNTNARHRGTVVKTAVSKSKVIQYEVLAQREGATAGAVRFFAEGHLMQQMAMDQMNAIQTESVAMKTVEAKKFSKRKISSILFDTSFAGVRLPPRARCCSPQSLPELRTDPSCWYVAPGTDRRTT